MIVEIMLKMFAMNQKNPINPLILIMLLVVNLLYFITVTTKFLPINHSICFVMSQMSFIFISIILKLLKTIWSEKYKPRYSLGKEKLYFILNFQTFQPLDSTVRTFKMIKDWSKSVDWICHKVELESATGKNNIWGQFVSTLEG